MKLIYNIYFIYVVFIIIGELIRRIYFKDINIILFIWMTIGIITIYVLGMAIIYRKEIQKRNINDIDMNKNYNIFSKETIIDSFAMFGTKHDKRYLDSNNYVYIGEFINIILSIILTYQVLLNRINNVKYVLYGQIMLASIYYLTFTQYKFDTIHNIMGTLTVSPWLFIPIIILIKNN